MSDFDPATRLDKSFVSKIRGASDAAKKRRSAMARESEAQKIRNAKWAGIKDGFLLWQRRVRRENWCECCGKICRTSSLELDHIHPRGRGGPDTAENAQLLCGACHRAKHGEPQWSSVQ